MLKLGYFTLPDTHPGYYLIYGGAQIFGGLYLIRGAPSLVSFAFPREDGREIDADEE